MHSLYALIVACTGTCPAWLPSQDLVTIFASREACDRVRVSHPMRVEYYGRDGKKVPAQFRESCARMAWYSNEESKIPQP